MLAFLVDICSSLVTYALLMGFYLSFVQRERGLHARILLASSGFLGCLVSFILFYLRHSQPKRMLVPLTRVNRQIIAVAGAGLLLALLCALLLLVLSFCRRSASGQGGPARTPSSLEELRSQAGLPLWLGLPLGFSLALASACLLMSKLPFILLNTKNFVAFGESSFGTESFFRLGGFLLGLLLMFLLLLAVAQLYRRMDSRAYACFGLLLLLAVSVDLGSQALGALARLRFLVSSQQNWVFTIMMFHDQAEGLIVSLYLGLIFLVALYVFLRHLRLQGSFPHSAARRKARYFLRNCRRWALAGLAFMLVSQLLLTVVKAEINKPVELTPPQPYKEQANLILIPLEEVNDGHLHRFSYKTDGHDVRFIVVKKPQGESYGVGLDACDICGVAGYFERNDEVICKRCDVVMNKATIGFKGGCNPVPFDYKIQDKTIIIDKSVLEAEKERFPKEQ